MSKTLVSWIGQADLEAMLSSIPADEADALRARLPGASGANRGRGPIRTLTDNVRFQTAHLLSTYDAKLNRRFIAWLDLDASLHQVELADPTSYGDVFTTVDAVMRGIVSAGETDFAFHLSPGTPAMAAVWVLLGKSRYPADFYQTYKDRAWVEQIPFDLVVDYVPEVLRDSDRTFQTLAECSPRELDGFERVIGNSRAIRLTVGRAQRAAARDVNVLIVGESGVGKELFARAMHAASRRRDRPFVAVNCAALPDTLLESLLFGHVKGAFSGAERSHVGAFDEADGGVLFLDEIGECSPSMQSKLLRVLQPPDGDPLTTRQFRRLGDATDRTTDVRIIAATNRDLHDDIARGDFRDDLYYRLAAITLVIPPLRERRTDIPAIADACLERLNCEFAIHEPGYTQRTLTREARNELARREWPGNVRELTNVLVQTAVMNTCGKIHAADVRGALAATPERQHATLPDLNDDFDLREHVRELERRCVTRALEQSGGVKTQAARLLGLKSYQALDAMMRRLDMTMPEQAAIERTP